MSYVMTIELAYGAVDRMKELTPDEYRELRTRIPSFELLEFPDHNPSYRDIKGVGFIEDVDFLDRLGFKVQVSRIKGQYADATKKLGAPDHSGVQVVNITIPNAALFAVQSVTVLEDACTSYLQSYLNKGWRLIAVCPPNDCRRPTYILGHTDTNAVE